MAVAKAALDAVVDLIDGGTAANPRLRIYNGSQPGRPDDAVGTQTLLAEIDLGTATVFGAAATGTGTLSNTATATASGILTKTCTSATATGTATWFRVVDKDATAIIDGSAGESAADLILDNASINAGQEVKLKTWKVKMPTGE
jgi:alkylated DNA nucleotide flippase Atl1